MFSGVFICVISAVTLPANTFNTALEQLHSITLHIYTHLYVYILHIAFVIDQYKCQPKLKIKMPVIWIKAHLHQLEGNYCEFEFICFNCKAVEAPSFYFCIDLSFYSHSSSAIRKIKISNQLI